MSQAIPKAQLNCKNGYVGLLRVAMPIQKLSALEVPERAKHGWPLVVLIAMPCSGVVPVQGDTGEWHFTAHAVEVHPCSEQRANIA